MYLLYTFALTLLLILTWPIWLGMMIWRGKYRDGIGQRLGLRRVSVAKGGSIWVHAVSVGEVLAISGLVGRLRERYPELPVFVSTTTRAGNKLARERFGGERVFYFPLDFGFAIRPYLRGLRPRLVILAETEFWPNFLRLTKSSGAKIAVVNARISDRSWPGYRRWRKLLTGVLGHVDIFLAQTERDRERLISIGAQEERIQVTGNMKYDIPLEAAPAIVGRLRESFRDEDAGPVLVFGSTVDGEEPLLLQAFANVLASYPRTTLLLAPRHPERFAAVASLLSRLAIPYLLRSKWQGESLAGRVLLIDSIGELASLYALADVAFVGGSLVPRGGHNIIEAARHGAAIIVGNHTENFREIVGLFQSRDAVRVVGPAEFPLVLTELLGDAEMRAGLGQRALKVLESQTGATDRSLEAMKVLLAEKNPSAAHASCTA
ncbi:MAG: 3-deoxy-D-manno-octulosonic acid transferase [Acidobacteriales bacterium]|nr:3-deoxy-D-manno-octulosonic acid transferase [Terriglobales bacterium]